MKGKEVEWKAGQTNFSFSAIIKARTNQTQFGFSFITRLIIYYTRILLIVTGFGGSK